MKTAIDARARWRSVTAASVTLAAALLLGACSNEPDEPAAEPASASPAGDRDTVFGLRLPADTDEASARQASPPAAPAPALDPRLPVNQAYTAEKPRDPSVHRVDETTTVATPMPFPPEALHSGLGSGSVPAAAADR